MKIKYFTGRQAYQCIGRMMLVACLLMPCVLNAQLEYLAAHYPLMTEKYKTVYVLQAWDVSGNAQHGNTWDPLNERYYESKSKSDYGFTGIPYLGFEFPTHNGAAKNMPDIRQKTVLYKPAVPGSEPVDLHVDIPDPLPNLTSATTPFTVCFWLNVADVNTQQTLIHTPHLGVWLKDKKIYVEHASSSTVARSASDMVTAPDTWYFIAITAPIPSYKFYVSGPNGPAVFENDPSAFTFSIPLIKSQILDADFKQGSIFGVRFYKSVLDAYSISDIITEDKNFGANDLPASTPRVGDNHYIKKNMYSHFPFDKQDNEAIDVMKKNLITRFGANDALTISNATAVDGRNANPGAAVKLSGGGRLTLKPFFGNYLDDYTSSAVNEDQSHTYPKGFTISFWIKLVDHVESDRGVIYPPFDNLTPRSRIFGLTDHSQPGNQNSPLIWGYSRINDRLSIRRYNDDVNPNLPGHWRFAWELWHYDPVSFNDSYYEQWYHVVYSQYAEWFKTYIYNPDGTPACQGVLWELQQALKNNPSVREWFIGSPTSETQSSVPDLVLDDFKIFNWPLIPSEVDAVHESETQTNPSTAARGCACSGDPAIEDDPVPTERGGITVYPNPATDKLTISLKTMEEGTVQYRLTDMQGRAFRTGSQKLGKGRQTIQLDGLNLVSGIYILRVEGAGLKDTRKIVIQN